MRPPVALRILIVGGSHEVAGAGIASCGCSITLADERAAVRMVRAGHCDLVIVTTRPDSHLQAAIADIRGRRPDLPIVLLPGTAMPGRAAGQQPRPEPEREPPPARLAIIAHPETQHDRHSAGVRGITAGRLTLDVHRLQADAGHGPVCLTRTEFMLLKELAEKAGQSVSRPELLAAVWGLGFDPGTNVVDACVRRLRAKLDYELIRTVRGKGYQLAT